MRAGVYKFLHISPFACNIIVPNMGRIKSYNISNCDTLGTFVLNQKKNVSDPKPHGVGDDETRLVDKRVD